MSKAKSTKSSAPKKDAPKSGLVVKNSNGSGNYAKPSSIIPNKGFSSSKKGGINTTPRKAK
jgi:hypothetical protein